MFDKVARGALAPLVLRLVLAAVFLYHGLHKIGPETRWGTQWGVQDSSWEWVALQTAVSWGEVLLGGVAIGLGLLTRLAAAGGVVVQLAAAYYTSLRTGFSTETRGGWELNLCLIGMCLTLVLLGGGTLSLDRLLGLSRRKGKTQVVPPAPVETPPLTPVG